MTEYDDLLAEAKEKVSILAKDYIPRLYDALMKEPNMTPKDAGERIKKDLADKWSRDTIYENLPDEAKDDPRGRPKKKDLEESIKASEIISMEQTTSGKSETSFPSTTVPDLEPVTVSHNNDQYDKLADEYNKVQEKLEGAEADNEYLKDQVEQLKTAVNELQKARPNLAQTTHNEEKSAIAVTTKERNSNKGFWVKFDLSNLELTRPLINILMRSKDRPKQFFIEVLGEDVVEVSESILR